MRRGRYSCDRGFSSGTMGGTLNTTQIQNRSLGHRLLDNTVKSLTHASSPDFENQINRPKKFESHRNKCWENKPILRKCLSSVADVCGVCDPDLWRMKICGICEWAHWHHQHALYCFHLCKNRIWDNRDKTTLNQHINFIRISNRAEGGGAGGGSPFHGL